MSVVKLEAIRQLGAAISCRVSGFADGVCVDQSTPFHKLAFPSLSISVEGSKYFPDQESIHHECGPNAVVMNVGRWEQNIVMRLGARSAYKRALLEQQVENIFFEEEGHPGILHTQLTACADLGPFTAAWEIDEDSWQNEKAFDRQLYSEMRILGIVPALVTRRGVYRMNQIRLGLDYGQGVDLEAADPEFDETEVIEINEDGTFTTL